MAAAFTHGAVPPTLTGLLPVLLSDVALRVNEIQMGKVLFAKILRPAVRVVGTTVLIEDPAGDCMQLALYNYVLDHEDPWKVLPQGSYIAFIHPYMRHARDDPVNGLLTLRCDNPQV